VFFENFCFFEQQSCSKKQKFSKNTLPPFFGSEAAEKGDTKKITTVKLT